MLNDLPQINLDIEEFSRTCLFAKMLPAPLNVRTIKAHTKVNWKFLKGEVDYLEMGNQWLLLRFSNSNDLAFSLE